MTDAVESGLCSWRGLYQKGVLRSKRSSAFPLLDVVADDLAPQEDLGVKPAQIESRPEPMAYLLRTAIRLCQKNIESIALSKYDDL